MDDFRNILQANDERVNALQGWVSIHRKIMNNPVWQDPKLLKLWMLCLLEASHKEHEQLVGKQIIKLEPGQFITGRFSLAESYNYGMKKNEKVNERTLWRWLKGLENDDFLTIKSETKYSVVTINNWNLYQHDVQLNDQQVSNKCPANVQQVSTNNNGNKGNNDNNLNTTTTTELENPIALFEKILCRLSPIQSHSLMKWVDEFEGKSEIVNEAITIADNKNKRYFGFVEFLLKEWANNNLESLDRIRAYEQEKFNKTKSNTSFNRKPIRKEKTPSWFEEGQQKVSNITAIGDGESPEEKRARLERIQQKYQKSGS
ncbi:DnaD domain-containing protein [Heyndrickxia oleronia]|uniref:DnaD domain protein n=1 Tax=Heyndrickxia oleronia TaxID=38875 RepID=A0AAW6SU35_9BACI|nr:DnaD domain protein [Heyndrickxia oleronia]MDH5160372.1 DnaD domain protein [Heyndrickxia oleronia]